MFVNLFVMNSLTFQNLIGCSPISDFALIFPIIHLQTCPLLYLQKVDCGLKLHSKLDLEQRPETAQCPFQGVKYL